MNFAFLKRNLGYKIFSLLVATLLYYVANAQQNPRVTRDIYVQPEVVKLADTLVVKDPPNPIPISVTGAEATINKMLPQSIKATVDGTLVKSGTNRLPIMLQLPMGLKTSGNGPLPLAQFTAEKKDQKVYGVDVLFAGTPPPGQEYTDPEARPSSVSVQGLSDDLKRVGRIVANVEREDQELAVDRMVDLVAEDQERRRVDGVEITPSQVMVKVKLRPIPSTKTMILSAEFDGKPAPGFRIATYEVSPSQIVVRGAIEAISSRSSITVPVDISNLSSSVTKTVTVTLPPGLQPQDPLPPVRVHLDVQPIPAVDGDSQKTGPATTASPVASPSP